MQYLSTCSHDESCDQTEGAQDGFNGSQHGAKHLWCSTSLASRRKRIHQHFDDLERCYFSIRQGDLPSEEVKFDVFAATYHTIGAQWLAL